MRCEYFAKTENTRRTCVRLPHSNNYTFFFFHSLDVITPALFLPEESQGTSFPFDPDRIRSPITRFPMLIFRRWRRKEVPEEPKVSLQEIQTDERSPFEDSLAELWSTTSWPLLPSLFHHPFFISLRRIACHDTILAKLSLKRCRFYFHSNYLEIHNFQLVEICGSIKMDTRMSCSLWWFWWREIKQFLKKINENYVLKLRLIYNKERNDTHSWSFDENNTTRLICISRVNAYTHIYKHTPVSPVVVSRKEGGGHGRPRGNTRRNTVWQKVFGTS